MDRIYKAAQATAAGGTASIASKRTATLDWFITRGIDQQQVYDFLGVKGMDDIGVEEIIRLKGVANAVTEGEISLHAIFNPPKDEQETADLDKALGEKP